MGGGKGKAASPWGEEQFKPYTGDDIPSLADGGVIQNIPGTVML